MSSTQVKMWCFPPSHSSSLASSTHHNAGFFLWSSTLAFLSFLVVNLLLFLTFLACWVWAYIFGSFFVSNSVRNHAAGPYGVQSKEPAMAMAVWWWSQGPSSLLFSFLFFKLLRESAGCRRDHRFQKRCRSGWNPGPAMPLEEVPLPEKPSANGSSPTTICSSFYHRLIQNLIVLWTC